MLATPALQPSRPKPGKGATASPRNRSFWLQRAAGSPGGYEAPPGLAHTLPSIPLWTGSQTAVTQTRRSGGTF